MKLICFVCQNIDCKLRGSEKIMNELAEKVAALFLDVEVKSYLCFGGCEEGPNVLLPTLKRPGTRGSKWKICQRY